MLYVNFSLKCLKYGQKRGKFPIFSLFWRPFFFTIATVKVKSIADFYTWAIVLINTNKKNLVKRDF